MASLLLKGDSYYCQFYYLGRRFTVTIGEVGKDEAEDFAGAVGQLLRRIKQGLNQSQGETRSFRSRVFP